MQGRTRAYPHAGARGRHTGRREDGALGRSHEAVYCERMADAGGGGGLYCAGVVCFATIIGKDMDKENADFMA